MIDSKQLGLTRGGELDHFAVAKSHESTTTANRSLRSIALAAALVRFVSHQKASSSQRYKPGGSSGRSSQPWPRVDE